MRLILLSLVALYASLSIAVVNECFRKEFEIIISGYPSGMRDVAKRCVTRIIDSRPVDHLVSSLIASGCLDHFTSDATATIISTLRECYEHEEYGKGDLRKRAPEKIENDQKSESTTAATTTTHSKPQTTSTSDGKAEKETSTSKAPSTTRSTTQTTTTTKPAPVVTTTSKSTSETTSSTTSQTPSESPESTSQSTSESTSEAPSVTPTPVSRTFSTVKSTSSLTPSLTSSPTTTSITAVSDLSSTSALVCLITTVIPTKVCSVVTTGTAAGQTTLQCVSKSTPVPTCAPGLICDQDDDGATTCIRRDNHLSTSGLVVTIVLAVAVGAGIIMLVVKKVRSSKRSKLAREQQDSLPVGGVYGKLGSRSDISLQPVPPSRLRR
ncbi:hypothetical protein F5884DRAFT_857694 [Xylogone sp. PMI_703]|nr:hypothetical protein F5884DRAFT_857694 [Xylogone sp. PMI_703]